MTDGSFNTAYNGVSSTEAALRTCAEMKTVKNGNPGIIIYSIAFKAGAAAETLMKGCASTYAGEKLYYNATDDETLTEAFEEIARDIKGLRLVN